MKIRTSLIATLVVSSATLIGCEERPEARPADRTVPTVPTTTDGTTTTSPDFNRGVTADAQRVQTLIQRVRQQMDAGQYDEAEETLRELEGMRTSLPLATQSEIDQLRDELRRERTTQPGDMTSPTSPGTTTPPAPGGTTTPN